MGTSLKTEKENERKRFLKPVAVLSIICITIALFVIIQINNSRVSGLKQSLRSFKLHEVSYPEISDPEPERLINITFTLENPSEFQIVVEQIVVTIYIDEELVWGGGIPLEEPVSPGQTVFFFTSRSFSQIGERALESVQSDSYKLSIDGEITGSSQFLFLKSQEILPRVFSKIVDGIPP